MNIITNNIPRPLTCLLNLPAEVQKEFDYIKGDDRYTPRLVQYKGEWYDVFDTMRCPAMDPSATRNALSGWDCYISETFFSGLVFKWVGDEVVVGRYCA